MELLSPKHRPPLHPSFLLEIVSRPLRHSAAGSIMSMKNSNDTIGNRTRDRPVCSTVLLPTAPTRAVLVQTVPRRE
jgi:hypothetical protein